MKVLRISPAHPRLKTRLTGLILFFCLLPACWISRAEEPADHDRPVSNVTVDIHSTSEKSFFGLGIQWDPYAYPPSPAAWKLTLHRLDFARPAFFRVMTGGRTYCDGFDAAGEPRCVWTQGEAAVRRRLGSLLDILDYAQTNNIDVLLGEWSPPGRLGEDAGQSVEHPDDPRWARLVTDFVNWLRTSRGYSVVRFYNLMNEPNGSWMWPGGKVNYEAWSAGIRGLRRQFDTHGLADLPIVGPDNSWNWEWADDVSRDMPGTIGAWEMHWYATDQQIFDGELEKVLTAKRAVILANDPHAADKRFFLAESGLLDGKCNGDQQPRVRTFPYGVMMADYAAQVAQAGWMGLCAWDLDDAMHTVAGHPPVPADTTLKLWGFWNTQGSAMGHPEDENIRPWFYTWSLMSRLFPRNARLLDVSATGLPSLRVIAGQTAGNHRLNIMLVNDANETRIVHVRVPGLGRKTVRVFHYFEKDRPTDAEGFPVPRTILPETDLSAGLTVVLTGRGCVFLNME
jgi:hypothetical protein